MPETYDQGSGSFVDLPEGWSLDQGRSGDYLRDDGLARIVMTGPHGRLMAQQKYGDHWVSICKPGANGNSYFKSVLPAITHADTCFPRTAKPRRPKLRGKKKLQVTVTHELNRRQQRELERLMNMDNLKTPEDAVAHIVRVSLDEAAEINGDS